MFASRKVWYVVAGLALAALVAWPVYAHCGKCADSCKQMVTAMDSGKMPLASAIAKAEEHSKGKAVYATANMEGGSLSFTVCCLVGDKIQEVTLDKTGKATGMKEAKEIPGHDKHEEKAPPTKQP